MAERDRDLERRLRALGGAGRAAVGDAGAGVGLAGGLASGLASRAAREGLLDVAYGFADSPWGPLLVAVTPRGLVRVAFPGEVGTTLAWLAREVSPRVLAAPVAIDGVRRELDAYFAGRLRRFATPVDLRTVPGFSRRVLEAAAAVPYGATAGYAEVAARAGSPRAARAAGNALAANPVPIVVPCHRILPAAGGLGGYAGGAERKRALLALEGAIPD